MRKVIWAMTIMAIFVCNTICVFAQEVNEETKQAVLRQQTLDQIRLNRAGFVEAFVGRWTTLTDDSGAELRNALMSLSDESPCRCQWCR